MSLSPNSKVFYNEVVTENYLGWDDYGHFLPPISRVFFMSCLNTAGRQKGFTITQMLLAVLIWSRAHRVTDLSMGFSNEHLLENCSLMPGHLLPSGLQAWQRSSALASRQPLARQVNAETRYVFYHTGQHGQEGQIRGWLVRSSQMQGVGSRAPCWMRLG